MKHISVAKRHPAKETEMLNPANSSKESGCKSKETHGLRVAAFCPRWEETQDACIERGNDTWGEDPSKTRWGWGTAPREGADLGCRHQGSPPAGRQDGWR